MAFEPVLPTAADWIRDPLNSWGRLWQAFNFKLDQYKAGVAQLPLLEGKLAGYKLAIGRLPASPARTNLVAAAARLSTTLTAVKNARSSLEGKVIQALADLRAAGTQLKQSVQTATVGIGVVQVLAAPIVGAALIAGAALVMYGITQWLRQKDAAVEQEKSVGTQIVSYAKAAGLSAEQTQALLHEASKIKPPEKTKDALQSITEALPWIVGLVVAVYFGPVIVGMLTKRKAAA